MLRDQAPNGFRSDLRAESCAYIAAEVEQMTHSLPGNHLGRALLFLPLIPLYVLQGEKNPNQINKQTWKIQPQLSITLPQTRHHNLIESIRNAS